MDLPLIYNSLSTDIHSILAVWFIFEKKNSPLLSLVFIFLFASESFPRGSTGAHKTPSSLLWQWLMFTSWVQSFWHNLHRAKRIKDFFFDSEAQCSLPADNERIELANGEISVVFMIKGELANGTDGTVSRRVGCDVEQEAPLWGNGTLWS